jgi:hypothetical protein
MMGSSVAPAYFEELYADNPDPWGYETSAYEKHKYAATLGALPRARFGCAFEPGCSIGVLTRMLASRCGTLVAADMSDLSLVSARARCRDVRNVRFRCMRIPAEWPNRTFDLIVLSEVLYYQSRRGLWATARKTLRSLRARGVVVLVHWLGPTGTARSGNDAAEQFIGLTRRHLRSVRRRRNARYRLDVLTR